MNLTPDDFIYDAHDKSLEIFLDRFAKDDDSSMYETYDRMTNQILQNQKDGEYFHSQKSELEDLHQELIDKEFTTPELISMRILMINRIGMIIYGSEYVYSQLYKEKGK